MAERPKSSIEKILAQEVHEPQLTEEECAAIFSEQNQLVGAYTDQVDADTITMQLDNTVALSKELRKMNLDIPLEQALRQAMEATRREVPAHAVELSKHREARSGDLPFHEQQEGLILESRFPAGWWWDIGPSFHCGEPKEEVWAPANSSLSGSNIRSALAIPAGTLINSETKRGLLSVGASAGVFEWDWSYIHQTEREVPFWRGGSINSAEAKVWKRWKFPEGTLYPLYTDVGVNVTLRVGNSVPWVNQLPFWFLSTPDTSEPNESNSFGLLVVWGRLYLTLHADNALGSPSVTGSTFLFAWKNALAPKFEYIEDRSPHLWGSLRVAHNASAIGIGITAKVLAFVAGPSPQNYQSPNRHRSFAAVHYADKSPYPTTHRIWPAYWADPDGPIAIMSIRLGGQPYYMPALGG